MANGSNRRLIQNTREQLISTDINRMQSFIAADEAEIFRALIAVGSYVGYQTATSNVAGFTEDHGVTESPLYGQVLSGLLCRPVDGSMTIAIDPGVAMVVDPDPSPSPDDSPYKLVRDPGGIASLTANASGSVRIDVLECSRSDVVTETDSRNQYDTTTGLFAMVSFSKVASGQFQYRVRAGTPGAGVPPSAAGWMPLCVIALPTGTNTMLDACSFWDVRPLVSARADGITHKPRHFGHFRSCRGSAYVSGANLLFEAQAETVDQWGYKLGGNLQGATAAIVAKNVDLTNAANQEAGFSMPTNGYYFVYVAVPTTNGQPLLGPRWSRYCRTGVANALQPMEPTGIVVVSRTAPDENGAASLTAPTSSGLACALRGYCVAMGATAGTTPQPFFAQGRRFTFCGTQPTIAGGTSVANVCSWTMAPDSVFPRCASSMKIGLTTLATAGGGAYQTEMNLFITEQVSGANVLCDLQTRGLTPSELSRMSWMAEIPLEALPLTTDATRTLISVQSNPNALIANTTASVFAIDF